MTRFALATGGTAGHIYPALAVAEELERRGAEVVLVRTGRPFQRQSLFGKARAILAVGPAVTSSRRVLRAQQIDAVFGFGGFAAIGPILAARSLGIWCAILEPNAALGMANRLLVRHVDRIYTGALSQFESEKARRVGLPVRKEIVAAAARRSPPDNRVRILRFDDSLPLDLDAEIINREAIASAYANCDLVVCRGGAGTLAEIAICGLPAVVVPLRSAAEDHQMRNATVYAERGAAVVADERGVTAAVASLMSNQEQRRTIGEKARSLAMPNAARDLVDDAMDALRY